MNDYKVVIYWDGERNVWQWYVKELLGKQVIDSVRSGTTFTRWGAKRSAHRAIRKHQRDERKAEKWDTTYEV